MKMFIVCLISLFAQGAFAKSIYKDAVTRDEDYKVKVIIYSMEWGLKIC